MRLEESFLEDIVRRGGIAHEPRQEPQKLGLVALDERAHGVGIAGAMLLEKDLVAGEGQGRQRNLPTTSLPEGRELETILQDSPDPPHHPDTLPRRESLQPVGSEGRCDASDVLIEGVPGLEGVAGFDLEGGCGLVDDHDCRGKGTALDDGVHVTVLKPGDVLIARGEVGKRGDNRVRDGQHGGEHTSLSGRELPGLLGCNTSGGSAFSRCRVGLAGMEPSR